MYIYVAQDWDGNVYVTDERDSLPSDVTDFTECWLPEKKGNKEAVLNIDIQDFSAEVVSLERK